MPGCPSSRSRGASTFAGRRCPRCLRARADGLVRRVRDGRQAEEARVLHRARAPPDGHAMRTSFASASSSLASSSSREALALQERGHSAPLREDIWGELDFLAGRSPIGSMVHYHMGIDEPAGCEWPETPDPTWFLEERLRSSKRHRRRPKRWPGLRGHGSRALSGRGTARVSSRGARGWLLAGGGVVGVPRRYRRPWTKRIMLWRNSGWSSASASMSGPRSSNGIAWNPRVQCLLGVARAVHRDRVEPANRLRSSRGMARRVSSSKILRHRSGYGSGLLGRLNTEDFASSRPCCARRRSWPSACR